MRTKVLSVLAVSLLGFLMVSVIAGVFLAEGTLHPGRRPLTSQSEMQARDTAARQHWDLADVTLVASDGVPLSAWSIRPRDGNRSAVILLHGLSDNRLGMIGYAEMLLLHGFTVLMPDARAHGACGGNLATYGLLESDDIRRWVDWLEENEHPHCVFGFAESTGAAQLLQSLRSETRFCAVAAESSFSNIREIAYDRVGQFFGTGPWLGRTILRPVVEAAFAYGKWKYKLDLSQASPERVVAVTTIPILLIHGRNDSNISVRHSRHIAGRNPALVLWEVPNADHCGAVNAAPQEFGKRLVGWFESHSSTG
ncbi:MAG TPA: alpha/beta fold hydrolase [Terriglobales bacterium]|nr:alpha/beta fold hydrolase [Terriglobales bacterium]